MHISTVYAVEKGLVFRKCWCFREHLKRYPWIFLIMLSPTLNIDGLGFWRLVGFWYGGGGLSLSLSGGWFALFITWLISFIFEDVTSSLVKCVVSSGCCWITLSICISFGLLFRFANFVSWQLLLTGWGLD